MLYNKNNNEWFNLNRCSSAISCHWQFYCKHSSLMCQVLITELCRQGCRFDLEKAHSQKAVMWSLIQFASKCTEFRGINLISSVRCIVVLPIHRFTLDLLGYFLSEPCFHLLFTCPSPPPVPTHVHICPICKKGMLARVFPHWCVHALQS